MEKWNRMGNKSITRFISEDQQEILYIFQTGFDDKWMVVFEDAHEITLGTSFIGTKTEVEQKFNIRL